MAAAPATAQAVVNSGQPAANLLASRFEAPTFRMADTALGRRAVSVTSSA
jgi:hypothetical protein